MEAVAVLIFLALVAWVAWDFWRTSPSRARRSRKKVKVGEVRRREPTEPDLPPELDGLDYVLEWFESDDGRGYILQRLRDRQRLSWQKLDPEKGLYAFYVRLASDLGDALHDNRFDPGSPLTLRTEEKAGEEVYSVWDESGEVQLGWVGVGDEERVRRMCERDSDPNFIVMWERLEGGRRKQVRALLAVGDAEIGKLRPGQRLS